MKRRHYFFFWPSKPNFRPSSRTLFRREQSFCFNHRRRHVPYTRVGFGVVGGRRFSPFKTDNRFEKKTDGEGGGAEKKERIIREKTIDGYVLLHCCYYGWKFALNWEKWSSSSTRRSSTHTSYPSESRFPDRTHSSLSVIVWMFSFRRVIARTVIRYSNETR